MEALCCSGTLPACYHRSGWRGHADGPGKQKIWAGTKILGVLGFLDRGFIALLFTRWLQWFTDCQLGRI